MDLYLFSSKNLTNIWAGIGARTWAVASGEDPAHRKRLVSKASNVLVGSAGVLYCSQTESFTSPFLIYSKPDAERVVTDVWPEQWILPFKIHPLGSPIRQLTLRAAKDRLPILRARPNDNPTHVLNFGALLAFATSTISGHDWQVFIELLADI
jgi:hypothetical protein